MPGYKQTGNLETKLQCDVMPQPHPQSQHIMVLTEIREAETEVHFFSGSGNDQKPASARRSGLKQRHSQKSGGFCEHLK